MVASQISPESLALILPQPDAADIRRTVELCLRAAGLSAWTDIEAELFPAGDQCLLIARPRPPLRSRGKMRRKQRPKF